MLELRFCCPRCGKSLKVRGDLVRPRVRCARCATVFRVPGDGRLYYRAVPPATLLAFVCYGRN